MARLRFTTSTTWTCPAGTTFLETLQIQGGGGGGASWAGGGGGGTQQAGGSIANQADNALPGLPGEYLPFEQVPVIPGQVYTITVGAGGNGGGAASGGTGSLTAAIGQPSQPGNAGSQGGLSAFGDIQAQGGLGGSAPPSVTGSGFNGGTNATAGASGTIMNGFQPGVARAGITKWGMPVTLLNFTGGTQGSGSAPGQSGGVAAVGGGGGGSTADLATQRWQLADNQTPLTLVQIPQAASAGNGGVSGSNGTNGQNASQLGPANSGQGGMPGGGAGGAGLGGTGGSSGAGSAGQAGYVEISFTE